MRDILVHDGAIVTPNSHATLLRFSRNGILFPAELGGWIDGSGAQREENVPTVNGWSPGGRTEKAIKTRSTLLTLESRDVFLSWFCDL